MRQFEAGDHVLLRDIWHGSVFGARPMTLLADDEVVRLHLAPGTRCAWPHFEERSEVIPALAQGTLTVRERDWVDNHVLVLMRPGDPYSPQLFVRPDGSLRLWYVNLQEPFTRTALGFDTVDWILDVVAAPDLSWWHWKDTHELAQAVEVGLVSQAWADDVQLHGDEVVEHIESGDAWWKEWSDWEPDPSLSIPTLPNGWDVT